MATKTMILRPSFTVDVRHSQYTVPSDTAVSDYYKLINEEIADDDTTYIYFMSGSTYPGNERESEFFTYGFNYNNLKTISTAKLIVRYQSGADIGLFVYTITILDKNSNIITTTEITVPRGSEASSEYVNYVVDLSNIIQSLNSLSEGYIHVKYTAYVDIDSKVNGIRFTQSYIELEYKEEIPIYIKQNNHWINALINGIYKKNNNSWILMDSSILQNKQKYIVNFIE